MVRYFLLFGIFVATVAYMGLSVCVAAVPYTLWHSVPDPDAGSRFSREADDTDCTAYNLSSYIKPNESPSLYRLKSDRSSGSERNADLIRTCLRDTHSELSLSDARRGLSAGGTNRPLTIAWAQIAQAFDSPAQQGTGSGPVARGGAGPVAGPVKQHGPTTSPGPQAPEDLSPPTEAPKRLPFQGSGPAPSASGSTADAAKSEQGEGVDGARKHLVDPAKGTSSGGRAKKKKAAVRQERRTEDTVESKPHHGTSSRSSRRRASGKAPMGEAGTLPAPSVDSSTTGGLPPLPPAIPYTPPSQARTTPNSPTIAPGADGSVMARVPGLPPAAEAPASASPSQQASSPQAQAGPRPLHPNNPISGFIMDSFSEPSTPVPVESPPPLRVQPRESTQSQQPQQLQPPLQPRQPRQPQQSQQARSGQSPGVLGQLGNDVQQLGAGIKGVFDRIIPGR
jgi:hypothetical protein